MKRTPVTKHKLPSYDLSLEGDGFNAPWYSYLDGYGESMRRIEHLADTFGPEHMLKLLLALGPQTIDDINYNNRKQRETAKSEAALDACSRIVTDMLLGYLELLMKDYAEMDLIRIHNAIKLYVAEPVCPSDELSATYSKVREVLG